MPKPDSSDEHSLVETEITSEDVEREIGRVQEIIDEYMSERPEGHIAMINDAISSGDRETADRLKDEVLENIEAQIDFVNAMESEELKTMANKLKAVADYYEQKF